VNLNEGLAGPFSFFFPITGFGHKGALAQQLAGLASTLLAFGVQTSLPIINVPWEFSHKDL
jgi:hypothetical protein